MASLEICCFNWTSLLAASAAGATRLELCGDAFDGGSTPNFDWFSQYRNWAQIAAPMYVMIRPRGGDFRYTPAEFARMLADVQAFTQNKHARADGLVFGILSGGGGGGDDGHAVAVDVARNKRLVEAAGPVPCTFHRAFDEIATEDVARALEDVVACGFRSVLTAGGRGTAVEGVATLRELVRQAGDRIDVVVGGGVRSENVRFLVRETGARWVHSSVLAEGQREATEEDIRKLLQLATS